MKKTVSSLVVMGLFAGAGISAHAAFSQDASVSVSAAAEVTGSHSLTVTPKTVVGDGVVGGITFPANGGVNALAEQYLEVAYGSNESSWGMNIWSDYGHTPTVAGENYGGLHLNFVDDDKLIPLGWQAFKTVAAHNSAPPATTVAPSTLGTPGWTFVKSKKDSNWENPVGTTPPAKIGYGRVLVGLAPNQAVINGTGGLINEATDPQMIVVYLASYAGSKGASAGSYTANLGFDLYHE